MPNKDYCLDIFGERMRIGDEIIPICDEAALLGIGGIISNIEYDEKYKRYYITITDKNGKVLLRGVDSSYYSTEETLNEMEDQKNIYNLRFYNNRFYPIRTKPLTSKTKSKGDSLRESTKEIGSLT